MDVLWTPEPTPCTLVRGVDGAKLRAARAKVGGALRRNAVDEATAAAEAYATMWDTSATVNACGGTVWTIPGRGPVCSFDPAAESAMVARLRVALMVRMAARATDRQGACSIHRYLVFPTGSPQSWAPPRPGPGGQPRTASPGLRMLSKARRVRLESSSRDAVQKCVRKYTNE